MNAIEWKSKATRKNAANWTSGLLVESPMFSRVENHNIYLSRDVYNGQIAYGGNINIPLC